MLHRRIVCWFVTLVLFASSAFGYDVGLAKVDVTPAYPIRMSGYNSRTTESEGVEQPLYARAIAVRENADHAPVVLVSVDSIGVSADMTEAVAARLAKKHQVPRANVAVCATHTHTGPASAKVAHLILAPPTPAKDIATVERYTKELTAKLGDAAEAAIGDLRPARVEWAIGQVMFAMNRRVLKDGQWTGFGDVADGPVDHRLPTLFVFEPGKEGKLRGVLINYACHCTTLGGKFMKLHGDWAGAFGEQWEREHAGCTALVSIGCGADANPAPRGDYQQAREHGAAVAREVAGLMKAKRKPVAGPIEAQRVTFDLPLAELPSRAEFEQRTKQKGPIAFHAKLNLERLDRGEKLPTTVPYSAQSWTFGDALAMVFLPGEVVVDYQLRLKRELDGKRLWINAYSNDSPCYIASKRVLAEGGYEVDGSMYYYDQPQHFAPEVEQLIIDRVRAIVPKSFDAAMRYAGEIKRIEARDRETPPNVGGILFIGSSTIRRWDLPRWFSGLPVVNHGFGGSYLSDAVFYFNELVTPVKPRQIVLYAGGNDVNAGKAPEQVRDDFLKFASIVQHDLPETRLTYVAIAPNPKRWAIIDQTRAANRLIREAVEAMDSPTVEFVEIEDKLLDAAGQPQPRLYVDDQLHFNKFGYDILAEIVRPHLK